MEIWFISTLAIINIDINIDAYVFIWTYVLNGWLSGSGIPA